MDYHLRYDAEIAVCTDKPYVHQESVINSSVCFSDLNGLHHTILTSAVHILIGTWHSVHTHAHTCFTVLKEYSLCNTKFTFKMACHLDP
jgi:hypothetical protein